MDSATSQRISFQRDESFAHELDAADPLRAYRDRFHIPAGPNGRPAVYFAGNSLGLQPKRAAELVNEEVESWARRGVEGHFEGARPWYSYHELLRESGARLVGAQPGEVVIMNSLTVNLHLMMVSFYRPTCDRYKIMIEDPCFPSDIYAVKSQLRYHGLDPAEALIVVGRGSTSPLAPPSSAGAHVSSGSNPRGSFPPSLPRRGQGEVDSTGEDSPRGARHRAEGNPPFGLPPRSPSAPLGKGGGCVSDERLTTETHRMASAPRSTDEHIIRTEEIEAILAREGERIALVMLGGVNFVTGQLLDMPRITAAAHARGCTVGFDLAHAAGNIPLSLHNWNVDFAVWCNYKYLNSGPGAVGGCFVHERHGKNTGLPRFGGWWGNDPATRFRMHLNPEFVPREGVDGWQVSNPPIFSMAPVKASYDIFDEVGMDALREKSLRLTGYLEYLLNRATRRSDEATEGNVETSKRRNIETEPSRDREGAVAAKDQGIKASRDQGASRAADYSPRDCSVAPAHSDGGEARCDSGGVPSGDRFEIITPRDPARRGCQLSLRFRKGAREVLQKLHQAGIICDFREPDVIRVAPVPLYNTFHDVWRFAEALS